MPRSIRAGWPARPGPTAAPASAYPARGRVAHRRAPRRWPPGRSRSPWPPRTAPSAFPESGSAAASGGRRCPAAVAAASLAPRVESRRAAERQWAEWLPGRLCASRRPGAAAGRGPTPVPENRIRSRSSRAAARLGPWRASSMEDPVPYRLPRCRGAHP